jgi:O-acetyl-ADP-ribose deacetylase (regulator of RNase III)
MVIQHSDVTALAVDALVSPSNALLAPGTDPAGRAIHAAAGPELATACVALGGGLPGQAQCTAGFLLPAPWVVHVVTPRWQGGGQGEERVLEACYENCLAVAFGAGATTIALPPLGIAEGFPPEQAARVAISTTLDFLENHPSLEQVFFCCARPADLDVLLSVADEYL